MTRAKRNLLLGLFQILVGLFEPGRGTTFAHGGFPSKVTKDLNCGGHRSGRHPVAYRLIIGNTMSLNMPVFTVRGVTTFRNHLGWRGSPHGGLTTSFSSTCAAALTTSKTYLRLFFHQVSEQCVPLRLVHLNPVAIDQHGEATDFREGQRQTVVGLGMASTILTRTDNPSSRPVLTGIRDSTLKTLVPLIVTSKGDHTACC
ncbi:MAG: hypothetical protein R3F44_13390 [Candidatus Competibacteraceae bacterium]